MEKPVGRPSISKQTYFSQIQTWLAEGKSLPEITATALQKACGGQYRKVTEALEDFKQGYEVRELTDLPDLPESLTNSLNSAALDIWRIVCDAKNKEIAKIEEKCAREVELAGAMQSELMSRIDDLEDLEMNFDERIAEYRSEIDKYQGKYESSIDIIASLKETLAIKNVELMTKDEEIKKAEEYSSNAEKEGVSEKLLELTASLASAEATIVALREELAKSDDRINALISSLGNDSPKGEETPNPKKKATRKKKVVAPAPEPEPEQEIPQEEVEAAIEKAEMNSEEFDGTLGKNSIGFFVEELAAAHDIDEMQADCLQDAITDVIRTAISKGAIESTVEGVAIARDALSNHETGFSNIGPVRRSIYNAIYSTQEDWIPAADRLTSLVNDIILDAHKELFGRVNKDVQYSIFMSVTGAPSLLSDEFCIEERQEMIIEALVSIDEDKRYKAIEDNLAVANLIEYVSAK